MKDFGLIHEMRLQGIGWQEIIDSVDWFTDNDRKVYTGWLLGKNDTKDQNTQVIKYAKVLQNIRLGRKQLGIERSINNEQIRDIALHQTFTEQMLDGIKERYTDFFISAPYPDKDYETAHIFTLADFHYNGDESYLEVLNYATHQIIRVVQEKDLKHIYLVELGDTIDGASLRTSQLMAVKKGMVNQVIDVADAYIKMITYLNEFTDITFISVDSSNHTQLRNLGTKQNQLIEEDLMLIFNNLIRNALPDLDMITGEDVYMNIVGFDFFFSHGHLVKSKEKYLETLQMDRNYNIDYGFFGHFHHQRSIDLHSAGGFWDKRAFYVPALATQYSPYENDKNLSSCAGVGYYVFKEKLGHVEERKLKI